ncbi:MULTISPECIES: YuiB family protein [Aneurinibacillus]|uniref:Putative membrane protein YuiB n=1 Tax=Aneurinibacillus danicus TaxID=267746 RepID=A0A511VD36_9BACL|nr:MULTISPECIES: YuiB family protein [Aneurinibacillus]GEN35172.1 putative membrane protein YuiB [Aneurinibacillus danicus]
MNIAQFIIGIPLFIVLLFGIGFILNMLIKTTWMPTFLYLSIVAGVLIYLVINHRTPHVVDYVMLTSGLLGAIASGWTIKILRMKGYRMF